MELTTEHSAGLSGKHENKASSELRSHWPEIMQIARAAKKSNRYFSFATTDALGNPHVTPIGHVFFREDMSAYYFDAYSKAMPKHFQHNKRVCVMAVNSSPRFWLGALWRGRFPSAPGVRLFGEVGEARQASDEELRDYQQSIRLTRRLKGAKLLWQDLQQVRDIHFTDFAPVGYPQMCDALWQ